MKTTRHAKIIEIINKYNVETQEELSAYLEQSGYPVTQATISRDIRELKLTKVSLRDGRQKNRYLLDTAQNILVIKTESGMAMAVAAALDAMECREIVGSIAGDDTIMCAVRTSEEAVLLMKRLRKLTGS